MVEEVPPAEPASGFFGDAAPAKQQVDAPDYYAAAQPSTTPVGGGGGFADLLGGFGNEAETAVAEDATDYAQPSPAVATEFPPYGFK